MIYRGILLKENFTAEKNGFTIRLAQKEDAENYFTQNFWLFPSPQGRTIASMSATSAFARASTVGYFEIGRASCRERV